MFTFFILLFCSILQKSQVIFFVPVILLFTFYINEKKIRELVESQTKRAHDYYKLAINMLPVMDKRNQKPGLMMGNIYYELLSKIIKNNPENILNQKASLSSLKKLSIVLLTLLNYQWIK